MLFAELPFDDENHTTMVKYIRESKYYMKGWASMEAKDLINKILQPDPYKRISMDEIISHPWFNKTSIPRYLANPFLGMRDMEDVDLKIVDQLYALNMGLDKSDQAQIIQCIKKSHMYDFCIAYEYLLHNKMVSKFSLPRKQRPLLLMFDKPKRTPNLVKTVK